ncbi:hypothetical protein [Actinoplanes sp. NPDC023714]|uniref:hypothetical protein n=1 Tax=Actinoplanes sp. NPDC023714 TaxID=3154322 RepID=UPI0033F3ACAA
MLHGRIVAESLTAETVLVFPDLRLTRLQRVRVTPGPGQPGAWTLIDVAAPEETADSLAEALSGALATEGGWYADFRVGGDHVVVFAGRIFRYRVGDEAGRQRAVDHGLSVGVPADQLDWSDFSNAS